MAELSGPWQMRCHTILPRPGRACWEARGARSADRKGEEADSDEKAGHLLEL
jgi:hypothetical protein